MNNKKKYYSVVNFLIKKSFPILKTKKLKIYEKEIKFSADTKRFPWFLRIRTNPRLRDYSRKFLIGIFAHELCHLEQFVKSSWFDYYVLRGFRLISDNFIKKEEEEIDKQAIRKGYAKELYLQRKSRWESKDKNIEKLKKFYLSPDELKKYAISIGKWK